MGTIDPSTLAGRINALKITTDQLQTEIDALDARIEEARPIVLGEAELRAYVDGLHGLLSTRPMDERRAFLRSWIREITADGKDITIQTTLPGSPGTEGGLPGSGEPSRAGRGGQSGPSTAQEVNQIRRVLSTARNSAPDASVARTCQTSFTLVRPRRLTQGLGEKKDRREVGWRAREWRRMLDQGVYKSQSALARGEGVSTAAVSVALKGVR